MGVVARLLSAFLALAFVFGVGAALFALARPNYRPSSGPIWDVLATPIASEAAGDLAAKAGVTAVQLIFAAALNSAFLAVLAGGLALVVGIPLGFWLSVHAPLPLAGSLRALLSATAGFPAYFVVFVLQVGAVELSRTAGRPLIPTFGFGLDAHLVIPVLALALAPCGYVARLVAIGAADCNGRDFIRTARAKGLTELRVVYTHILPNMVGAVGEAVFGGLRLVLAGLVIVEYLVSWPGLGYLVLRAIRSQDAVVFIGAIGSLGIVFLLLERALDLMTERTGAVTG